MKNKISILMPVLLLFAHSLMAQVPDSISAPQIIEIQPDTIQPKATIADTLPPLPAIEVEKRPGFIRRFLSKDDYPNPNKALYLSIAIPGGGQFYNKRYWKVPIVYGGYAFLIYAARFNSSNYRDFRDAYIAELDGVPHKFSGLGLDAGDLRRLRDGYDKNKQLSYIGIFALHIVQAAEAFVDCHLKTFDVSDDLSLKVGPSFQYSPTAPPTPGIGFTLSVK